VNNIDATLQETKKEVLESKKEISKMKKETQKNFNICSERISKLESKSKAKGPKTANQKSKKRKAAEYASSEEIE